MMPRRRFLSFLGAAPIAGRAAADEIAKVTGIRADGLGAGAHFIAPPGDYPETNPTGRSIPYEVRLSRAVAHMETFGLPSWAEDEMRNCASYVEGLDPDLAAKRSWSMCVKVTEQRQRNYARRLEAMRRMARDSRERTLMRKVLGFDWPW